VIQLMNEVSTTLADTLEPIDDLYTAKVPKVLRFILWPMNQCLLGILYVITTLILCAFKGVQKLKDLYDNYE
jgi:hypothetical protein